jgi:hypothetical protein
MAYVLAKITPEDQQKILADAECDLSKKRDLAYAIKHGDLTKNWAIDRNKNCYLLFAPVIVREVDWEFFIFCDGNIFGINFENPFSDKVFIESSSKLSQEKKARLQSEIRDSFSVYGRFGKGTLDEDGKPRYSVAVEFEGKEGE